MFEKICTNKKNSPNFVASTLCSTITNLQRKGLDSNLLKPQEIIKSFEFLTTGKISKESMEIIFELIMSGKTKSVEESIDKSSLKNIDGEELYHILEKVINYNMNILQSQ